MNLSRVVDQVDQHLPQAPDVTHQLVRDIIVDVVRQLEPALLVLRCRATAQRARGPGAAGMRAAPLDLRRLDPEEVHDLVDRVQQMLGRDLDGREVPLLLGGEAGALDEVRAPDDRVQRCPELVAHARQEPALARAEHLGAPPRLFELARQVPGRAHGRRGPAAQDLDDAARGREVQAHEPERHDLDRLGWPLEAPPLHARQPREQRDIGKHGGVGEDHELPRAQERHVGRAHDQDEKEPALLAPGRVDDEAHTSRCRRTGA